MPARRRRRAASRRYTFLVADPRRYQLRNEAANRLILDLLDAEGVPAERRGFYQQMPTTVLKLHEDGAAGAIHRRDPAGGAVKADFAVVILVLHVHQPTLLVGLKRRIVGFAKDDRVPFGEAALRIERAPGLQERVVARTLRLARGQLRVRPDAPAAGLGVDVLHGRLEAHAGGAFEDADHA